MAGKGKTPEKGRNMKKWYASDLWVNLKKNAKTSKSKCWKEPVQKKRSQHTDDYSRYKGDLS